MFKAVSKAARKIAHGVWTQEIESSAIMTGTPIEVDWRDTGDNYSPSPVVRESYIHADYEIRETRTVHERGRA